MGFGEDDMERENGEGFLSSPGDTKTIEDHRTQWAPFSAQWDQDFGESQQRQDEPQVWCTRGWLKKLLNVTF